MKITTVLFDLDGTITEPFEGITKALSYSLEKFGIKIENTGSGYKVESRQSYTSPREFKVEGDWSNGAFWLVAVTLKSSVSLISLLSAISL